MLHDLLLRAGLILAMGPVLLFAQDQVREGIEALRHQDWSAAVTALEPARASYPSDVRIWIGLARAYQQLGRKEDAQRAVSHAEALPDTAFVAQGLAIYHAEGGRAPEARHWIGRAQPSLSPSAAAGLNHLAGQAIAARGLFPESIPFLEQAVSLDPYEAGYWADLVQAALRSGRFAEALEHLACARETFSKSPQLELLAGVAYYSLRRFDEAADAFLRVIALDPDIPQPYAFLDRMLTQVPDRLPMIEKEFSDLAKRTPSPFAQYLQARTLTLRLPPSGNPKEAAQAKDLLLTSIAGDPSNAQAHAELAYLLEREQKYPEAAQHLEEAIRRKPSDSTYHYRLARIYHRAGEPAKAAAARRRHAELESQNRKALDKHGGVVPDSESVPIK